VLLLIYETSADRLIYRYATLDPDWSNKKSFPEVLVGPVKALGRKAIDLRIMDDPFFDVLPNFIRYNRFTMRRWILNNCKDYVSTSIEHKETELMAELKSEVDKLAEVYIDERDKAVETLNEERESYIETACPLDPESLSPGFSNVRHRETQ
jgi:hypothetical protein